MTRRKKNNTQNAIFNGSPNYWATAGYNQRMFLMFRQQIMALAMTRYQWINLPQTCDERYLEFTLLTQGCATISFPRKQPGIFYSTQVAYNSPLNVYDNPTKWLSIGNNGWRFSAGSKSGVIVWDNVWRVPIVSWIDIWARELTDITRTMQMNRMHQKVPYIIKGPQEKQFDMNNLYKQIAGAEPAVIATDGISAIDVDVLKTDVPFLGEELVQSYNNCWADIYRALGIPNGTYKQERMIEDEVRSTNAPTTMMALTGLDSRREAAERLNSKFPQFIDEPIDVVMRTDNTTNNYNTLHTLTDIVSMMDDTEGDNDETVSPAV